MKSKLLAEDIKKAIDKIDPELDYREFADAVAIVITEEYGKHLVDQFVDEVYRKVKMDLGY